MASEAVSKNSPGNDPKRTPKWAKFGPPSRARNRLPRGVAFDHDPGGNLEGILAGSGGGLRGSERERFSTGEGGGGPREG